MPAVSSSPQQRGYRTVSFADDRYDVTLANAERCKEIAAFVILSQKLRMREGHFNVGRFRGP